MVGKMKSERSYLKYCTVYNHLSEFIRQRYKMSDIALRELTPAFITDFELFLRTEKNHCTNTVWSYMMPFRSIIYTAINNGWLPRVRFYASRGNEARFPDERGNHDAYQWDIQKEKL